MTLAAETERVAVHELAFDVAAAVPGAESCVVRCSLHAPRVLTPEAAVVVAVPGGSYNRRYWDMQPEGRSGYSQARYFAERNVVFAALDWVGAAEESRPADGDVITMTVAAEAAHLAFEQLRDALALGERGLPRLDAPHFVGMGQSLGGSVVLVQQAHHRDYAAIALLGTSDSLTKLGDTGLVLPDGWESRSAAERRDFARAVAGTFLPGGLSMYHPTPRAAVAAAFYAPDTAAELIAYDEAHLHTLTPRNLALDTATPGFNSPYTGEIACPVFLGFGLLESGREPHAQPPRYAACRDVTLCLVPEMAHMHNFADTRAVLWDRVLAWLAAIL